MTGPRYEHLFDFSASYIGGGLKRLTEYARWFDANGGAWFVVHPQAAHLVTRFPVNRYFVAHRRWYQRLNNDSRYLERIRRDITMPDLFYSYGMPIGARIGHVNWFHLSNILPIYRRDVPLPASYHLKCLFLGWQIRHSYKNAEIVSAESEFSLKQIHSVDPGKLVLSVNGSDDELRFASLAGTTTRERTAVVIGTQTYKALWDSYRVFEMLREQTHHLVLLLIGDPATIPRRLAAKPNVQVMGILKRDDVVRHLEHASYYISTTLVENSSNASSEGLFLAEESYLSDIDPHRELLRNTPFEVLSLPNVRRGVIRVRRVDAVSRNLRSWHDVITDMLNRAGAAGCSEYGGARNPR